MEYGLNDIVELKKDHPCKKSKQWQIIRMGADIKIKCLGCDAIVMLPREKFNKRIKRVIKND
ncbi:hypothetical protein OKW22_000200 [Bacilli bacterium PM5-3]|nr:hypothetical protein [Bacilli bacterium PM5-3]MDH6603609.1 hypothetical protein [Bacilli bacterium PM5-9]